MALSKEANAYLKQIRSEVSAREEKTGQDYSLRDDEKTKDQENNVAGQTMYVAVSSLNVRKGAGRRCQRVGSLPEGKAVNVLEKSANGWYKINFGTGVGWVKGKFLTDKSGNAQINVPDEDTSESAGVADVEAVASEEAESAGNEASASAENAISDDGVALEDGNYINKTGVKMRKTPSDSAGVVSLTVVKNNKTYTTTLKPGMVVRPTGETKQVGNDVWSKVSHTWRKTKFVGWIKNLDEVSDHKSVVGNASGEAKKFGGTGLAKDVVSETEGSKNKASTGYCQRYVKQAAAKAAGTGHSAGDATEAWQKWSVSTDISSMPVGAAVYFTSPQNSAAGHVGLHRGNGEIAHQLGGVTHESLAKVCERGYRFRAWGWQGGVPLK